MVLIMNVMVIPMKLTLEGIETDFNDVQCRKELVPNICIKINYFIGMIVIIVVPIFVTLVGIFTVTRLL